jgi:hypothetical protein
MRLLVAEAWLNWPALHSAIALPTAELPVIDLVTPRSSDELQSTRAIFREYADTLGVDLCFQGFERGTGHLAR